MIWVPMPQVQFIQNDKADKNVRIHDFFLQAGKVFDFILSTSKYQYDLMIICGCFKILAVTRTIYFQGTLFPELQK